MNPVPLPGGPAAAPGEADPAATGSLLAPTAPAPRWIRVFGRLVDWSVILIGGSLALLVFLNVALHLVHLDLAWVTELGELLMVWVTFLGGACAAQRGTHMAITEFVDKLTAAQRRWADGVIQGLCLAMLLVLDRHGWSLVQHNWGNELTVLGWPMAIQYMGMALGCCAMTVFVAHDLWQIVRGVDRVQRYGTGD